MNGALNSWKMLKTTHAQTIHITWEFFAFYLCFVTWFCSYNQLVLSADVSFQGPRGPSGLAGLPGVKGDRVRRIYRISSKCIFASFSFLLIGL